MKTFRKLNCALCMHERVEIIWAFKQEKDKIVNIKSEIFGACHHKTKFHKFLRENRMVKCTSTDDGICQKRVPGGGKSEESTPCLVHTCHLEGEVTVCLPASSSSMISIAEPACAALG
jgi:hypothetical protein